MSRITLDLITVFQKYMSEKMNKIMMNPSWRNWKQQILDGGTNERSGKEKDLEKPVEWEESAGSQGKQVEIPPSLHDCLPNLPIPLVFPNFLPFPFVCSLLPLLGFFFMFSLTIACSLALVFIEGGFIAFIDF